jgi:hypothetical protein
VGPTLERVVMRVWIPDSPGALAALAATVADGGGNVVGLEVLERVDGAALDELLIELEDADRIDHLCRKVASADGTTIEEVRPVAPDADEHGMQVLDAAQGILTSGTPTVALEQLVEAVSRLFDTDWCAVLDARAETVVARTGRVPPTGQLLELLDPAVATPAAALEVVLRELEESGFTLCAARPIAFRHRELRQIEMLVRVTDRTCRPLRRDRIPPEWSSRY